MITMILGGLWHGAALTFVLWGAFHGVALVTEHAFDGRIGRRTPAWLCRLGTFALVCFAWILFRSPDLDVFLAFLGRMFEPGPATLFTIPVVGAVIVVVGIQLLPHRPIERVQLWIESRTPVALAVGLAAVILLVGATVPSQGVPPFIYFQF